MTKNQIEYQKHLETKRANQASESLRLDELKETGRHNLASELELNRSNVAREIETSRHNVTTERENQRHNIEYEQETNRHNTTVEGETKRHNLASEQADLIKASASVLSAQAQQSQASTAAARLDMDNRALSHNIGLDFAKLNETRRVNTANISYQNRQATSSEKQATVAERNADTRVAEAWIKMQDMLNTAEYNAIRNEIEWARTQIQQGQLDETAAHNDVMEYINRRGLTTNRINALSQLVTTILKGVAIYG